MCGNGIEPRTLCRLGMCITSELHLQPRFFSFNTALLTDFRRLSFVLRKKEL